MKRKKYTRELKKEAVRLSEESDAPLADVAFDLGVHQNTLYKWRRELLRDGEEALLGQVHLKPGDDEVRRLQRELARVRPLAGLVHHSGRGSHRASQACQALLAWRRHRSEKEAPTVTNALSVVMLLPSAKALTGLPLKQPDTLSAHWGGYLSDSRPFLKSWQSRSWRPTFRKWSVTDRLTG